ncbi:hypothetical protein BVC80_8785g14 [Macleaya cordata]|uniref:Transmembrane protein n=1 Tax=Macleaya cordata TaxID=56857 RepID=A0A200PVD8_MACCD|nr:hypothetical protein BVC80_8785g14 [Macleaya cordata]
MEIPEKLLKFKFHIIFTTLLSLLLLSLFLLAPRFLTILSYFWPLFVSTALFLIAVVFFAKVSPPITETTSCEKAGEGLLDYVAGQPEEILEQIDDDDDEEEEEEDNTQTKSDQKSEKASEFLAKASNDDDDHDR